MARLAIFDLDGTLIDTNRVTVPALRELSGRFGLEAPPERAVREAMGLQDPEFYRTLFPDAPGEALAALSALVERREGKLGRTLGPVLLFPGVAGMLERLRAGGVILCLASTGSADHVRDMLEITGLTGTFSDWRCDAPAKAAMTGELLEKHGRQGAAFVGDMAVDVAAARANGIPVYGAGYGYVRPRERDLFDAVADTPGAMVELLMGD